MKSKNAKRAYPENIKTARDFVKASKRGEEIKYTNYEFTRDAIDAETGENFKIFGGGIKV